MSEQKPDGSLRNTIYRRVTVSGRRMGPVRRCAYLLAAPLLLGIIRLWWRSCRIVAVAGEEHLQQVLARWPSFLPCYWHQHQLFCARYLLREQQRRQFRLGFLISPSVDGELGAMIVRRAGGAVIRGSSSHTGALALKTYFEALMRERVSPIITPDGPRGPRFKFKPGAILLAQMSGRPMLPLSFAASRATLVHWDRFVLPWPFARIAIGIGAPREVPRALEPAAMAELQLEMEHSLHAAFKAARAALQKAR
ncbi:MAG: lysophospholipid acyltransferase family protein [Steroidobacteraceae bacterium]